ncbi:hypothetical protein EMIT0194MI4_30396 [Pseudomonas sp. IT-194MI4]
MPLINPNNYGILLGMPHTVRAHADVD